MDQPVCINLHVLLVCVIVIVSTNLEQKKMAIEDIREEGGEKQEQIYKPSVKEVATINRVFERFQRMKEERDKTRREFDGF